MVLVTPAPASEEQMGPDGKTTKITTIESKKSGSGAERRLVEYFVVISSVPQKVENSFGEDKDKPDSTRNVNATAPTDWKVNIAFEKEEDEYVACYDIKPIITARFPVQDHRDNPLHENVTFFCHPSGGIRICMEPNMPKVHFFCATGGHGAQMYGTCFTVWEPTTISAEKAVKDAQGNINGTTGAPIQQEVYLPKCLVILSSYPYLMAFREYLTQLNRLSKLGEMTLPLERYIINFCSEIPAPPPGSFEVQITILDSVIKFWSPPHNQPIAWVSLPFAHLFECLDIDNIVLVWHCLVLERQVLLTSTQLSILTVAAEVFLSLLFPMKWSHAYIPVLPHFLIPILSAPMPFLCGINKANLADALYDLSSECVLVDLDKNLVTLGPDTEPLPPIPPGQLATLKNQLEENVGMVFREARCLTKNDDYSDSGAHLPNHIKLMAEGMWESKLCLYDEAFHLLFTPEEARKNLLNGNDNSGMDYSDRDINDPMRNMVVSGGSNSSKDNSSMRKQSQWDAVQEAFLDTFVFLLRNFRKYLVFPSKHNEGSYGGAGFRSKEFIESQRFDMREFLEQLIGTQMFDNFITKRLYGSGEADVAFFDTAVDRFLKTAGYLSDVDITGRLMHAGGVVASSVTSKTGSLTSGAGGTPEKRSVTKPPQAPLSKLRNAVSSKPKDPILQSARVHRRLKTIVPPEPSGEGLPPHSPPGDENDGVNVPSSVAVTSKDNDTSLDDAGSVDSTSSVSETGGTSNPNAGTSNYKSVQDKAAEIMEKQKKMRYTYSTFPSEFNEALFGNPRPLPSAVISEFDRQRKDAAKFSRSKKSRQSKDKSRHIHRAHTTTETVDPPSPEVATFTVFFMAFTSMVGKELMELDHNPSEPEKTILSTYVPMSNPMAEQSDDDISTNTGMTSTQEDAEEKEGIADLKATRPDMNGMFGDDDDEAAGAKDGAPSQAAAPATAPVTVDKDDEEKKSGDDDDDDKAAIFREGDDEAKSPDIEQNKSEDSADSKPKLRFKENLSASQIEEAKATGRAQLGLAFEMLTMMKKRALKADPDAYQCLIDACGRVGDTKRATELLAKMHEDGIVADGTVYACLVSAFSAESAWKKNSEKEEDLPAWANSTSIEMDWNKLQKRSLLDRLTGFIDDDDEDDADREEGGNVSSIGKIRQLINRRRKKKSESTNSRPEESRMEFFVTEAVERQIALGENLLEIVFPDISVDTENETCPRCNFLLSDDDVVGGWTAGDENDYTTSCPSCTQRFVPHFCVQSTSQTFMGSRGPASPLMCERLSPWVLQKEIRSVMNELEGIENLLSPEWREQAYKNGVLWWNLVLSCMRYRFPFSFLLQGSFEQNLIAPMPGDE
ncbi:DENN domain-containing protein 5B [Seminavis robusta]|uniref:DENN domain-containing protein 5B n=1 Tax=Seminavis robusta TaxID=568900 RepID=A0A9N8DE59_9STRA|nr:DENN domain-containing protein 5B [Seminavis robusta]|eukprot:Sro47_g027810.1 DENN domain-containing protein 5B (1350) ;mRNA; f:66130-70469